LRSGNLPLSSTSLTSAPPSITASLPSLPSIPKFEPLGTELLPELEIERPTRELDGSLVVAPFELNSKDNGDEGCGRTC
jgi:hypothetical protein